MSLTTCDDGHQDIAYNHDWMGRGCPLCVAHKEIESLEEKIEKLEKQLEQLQEELDDE